MKRQLTVALVLCMIAAACGGDSAEDTTNTVSDTTTTEATTDTTTQATTSTTSPEPVELTYAARSDVWSQEGFGCAYLTTFIVTDTNFAGGTGFEPVWVSAILDEINADGESDGGRNSLLDSPTFGNLQFWRLTGSDDALTAAGQIQSDGGAASPINLVAPMAHWSWEPGESAIDQSTSPVSLQGSEPAITQTVAVVDTGLVSTDQGWIDNHVSQHDDLGEMFSSGTDPSHGTFIASVIRQVSPTSNVALFRPEVVGPTHITELGETIPGPLTSEVQVLEAIVEAAGELQTDASALNLSVGTYACGGTWAVPTIQESIAAWQQQTGGAPVVAAAGNELIDLPFYPAALPDVLGVAGTGLSTEGSGWVLAWDHTTKAKFATDPHPWATVLAPGEDLVGYGGTNLISWSGSSFATAVASALIAEGILNPSSISGQSPDVYTYAQVPVAHVLTSTSGSSIVTP